jgi:hypothetical protein
VVNLNETGQDLSVVLTDLYLTFCNGAACHNAQYLGPDLTLTSGEGTGTRAIGIHVRLDPGGVRHRFGDSVRISRSRAEYNFWQALRSWSGNSARDSDSASECSRTDFFIAAWCWTHGPRKPLENGLLANKRMVALFGDATITRSKAPRYCGGGAGALYGH